MVMQKIVCTTYILPCDAKYTNSLNDISVLVVKVV